MPTPEETLARDMPNLNPARWTYERLGEYIQDFEADLDDGHEIGARLVSFGSVVTFHVDDVGYFGPDIISVCGKDDNGQSVQLIQNVAQLSVLLVAMKKRQEKPRRIGFIWDKEEEGEDSNGEYS
jgi:hypothetical protein